MVSHPGPSTASNATLDSLLLAVSFQSPHGNTQDHHDSHSTFIYTISFSLQNKLEQKTI